jgi:two-component system OmpR family response regulator
MSGIRRQRVLIAEDDSAIRRMLTVSLRKQGYRTAEASDGGEALDAMRAGEADLVVLDLSMPKVTGWEVLTERAAAPELRKIPVIVITAERGTEVESIPSAGVSVLLPKPFELDVLQALVKSCLDEDPPAP